jgi:endonuclease I
MMKKILFTLLSFSVSLIGIAQGSETFTNTNGSVASTYTAINWTGDNTLPWTANSARNDEGGGSSSVTGMTGDYLIVRNTTGIISCSGIPNGCTDLSFKYAKAFTAAGNIPTFGLFINGTQVGTTITASSNAAQTATFNVNVTGTFNLEIRQLTANDQGRLAIDDIVWTGLNNNPPCAEPSAQPSGILLNSTPTTVSGSFTAASPAVDEYLVVRSTLPTLSADPLDGTAYAAGQSLGGGTIVGIYTGTAFTDINLTASTLYYYFVYGLNSQDCNGGPNYLVSNPLAGSVSTQALPACITPAAATAISLTAANNFISGSFTTAAGNNKYLVIISTSASLGVSPVNGINYTQGQTLGTGTIVSFNTINNFTATGLNTNTLYYLFVFTGAVECSGQPFYSTSLNGSTTTTNTSTGIPAGYYDATNGLTCQPLKSALQTITGNGYVNIGYDGVYNAYQFTDIKPSTTNIIWDIYTDDNDPAIPETFNFTFGTDACGNYNSEGDCYNREHSTPKSWFNDASPMYSDIQHLLPTDGWVNGARSNWPYGEVTNANFTSIDNQSKRGTGNNFGYTGTVFQPFAAFRGDVARISLYMATRYEDLIISQNWAGNAEAGPVMLTAGDEGFDAARRRLQIYNTWYIKTIFKWMSEDPVSQKEIDRNNAIYYQSGQHNRNPFIDHPEYAALIWQCTGVLPVTITDFVAQKQSESVLLKWYATMETNFNNYEIERSPDGIGFYKIGSVQGRNLANYSFTDADLPTGAIVYYRLKLIDIDGTYSYSKTLPVRLNNNLSNAMVYPNPTSGPLSIKLTEALKTGTTLVMTDIAGRMVKQQLVNKGAFSINLDVSTLPGGRYFISINDKQNIIRQSVVVIK